MYLCWIIKWFRVAEMLCRALWVFKCSNLRTHHSLTLEHYPKFSWQYVINLSDSPFAAKFIGNIKTLVLFIKMQRYRLSCILKLHSPYANFEVITSISKIHGCRTAKFLFFAFLFVRVPAQTWSACWMSVTFQSISFRAFN